MSNHAAKQIKDSTEIVAEIMRGHLMDIANSIIKQVVTKYKALSFSKKLKAIKNIKIKGVNEYKSDLKAALAVISSDAIAQARIEVPAAKNFKFMEKEHRLMFGEFENLAPGIRTRITHTNDLLIGTQIADLEKNIFLQFTSSADARLTPDELQEKLTDRSASYISGNSVNAAASVTSASMVNDSRNAFFTDPDVFEEIAAFKFYNRIAQVDICKILHGRIFSKNDPDHFTFTPPLHYNCRSTIIPVLKLEKDDKIVKLRTTNKKALASIQFSCHDEKREFLKFDDAKK